MLLLEPHMTGIGVGGLAAAYMLSKSGHHVRVLEKYSLDAPSGGLRLPPNVSKILRQWVGQEELLKTTTRCAGTPFYHCETSSYSRCVLRIHDVNLFRGDG